MTETMVGRVSPTALVKVMTRPRETLRQVLDLQPDRLAIPLVLIATFSQFLMEDDFEQLSEAVRGSSPAIGALIVFGVSVLSIAFVLVFFFAASHLVSLTGKLLGGAATPLAVRSALAWGSVPLLWALPWRISVRAIWGSELVSIVYSRTEATPLVTQSAGSWTIRSLEGPPEGLLIPLLLFTILEVTVAIWYIVLMCKCLGEAHGFSAWRGLGTLVLSGALIIVGLLIAIAGIAMMLA